MTRDIGSGGGPDAEAFRLIEEALFWLPIRYIATSPVVQLRHDMAGWLRQAKPTPKKRKPQAKKERTP